MNLNLSNAPSHKKCPPHNWVFKANFEGRSKKKKCTKCGQIDTGIHKTSFYDRT